jgi:hypothetical protein
MQTQIPRSDCLGWSVKRESVERCKYYDALTLHAPTLHASDARQSQFVRVAPKSRKLLLHER